MLNKIILVEVSGQNLIVQEKLSSVRATVGLIEVAFTFDSYWDNFTVKKAHFQNSNDTNAFTKDIINGKCEVPLEVLFYRGVISVAAEGTNINGQVERTNPVDIIKQTETIIKGRNCINPTPDQYTQFIKTVDEKVQEGVSGKADNLDIDGKNLQLKSGDAILSTVAIPAGGSYYNSLRKIDPEGWLYEIVFDECDYDYAYDYFENEYKPTPNNGACSAVYKDGIFGKNLDWYYNNNVEFLIRSRANKNRYASVSMSGGIVPFTKQGMEAGEYSELFKVIPFMASDGVNEKGLYVGMNVVPFNETKGGEQFSTPTTGTHPESTDRAVCTLMLSKVLLDNYDNATSAVEAIRDEINVYSTDVEGLREEYHLLICDENKQYIVEFINNSTEIIDVTNDMPWMTNFYRYGTEFNENNEPDYHTLTDHAIGVERSNIIAENYNDVESTTNMLDLMAYRLAFTNAYTEPWIDELTGIYPEPIGELTIADVYEHPEKFNTVLSIFQEKFENRDRSNPETWFTSHSCAYNFYDDELHIRIQEQREYYFPLFEETLWERGEGAKSVCTLGNSASGRGAVAVGESTHAVGDYSFTEGVLTQTRNYTEHAMGCGNVSHTSEDGETWGSADNTLFSIGIGDGDRRWENALEVMQNGDVYIKGVGDYDGRNYNEADTLQEVVSGGVSESFDAIIGETDITDIISAFEGGKQIIAYINEGSAYAFLPLTEVYLEDDKYTFCFTESIVRDAPDDTKLAVINVVKCYEEDGETIWDVGNTPVAPVNYCYYNILGVSDTPFNDVARYIGSDSVIKLTFTTDDDKEVTIQDSFTVIDNYDGIQFNAIVGTDLYIIMCTRDGWGHYVIPLVK